MKKTIDVEYDGQEDSYKATQHDPCGEWDCRDLEMCEEEALDVIAGLTKLVNKYSSKGTSVILNIHRA